MVIFHCYVIVHQRVYSGHHHFSTTICCVPKHLLVGQSCEVMTYEVFSRQKKVLHCLQAWWIPGFGWVVGNGRCLKIWFRRTDLMWPNNKSFNTSEVKNPSRLSFFSLSSVFFNVLPVFTTVFYQHIWPSPPQIAQALRQLWELGGEDMFYYKLVAPLLGRKEWGCWLVCDTWPV